VRAQQPGLLAEVGKYGAFIPYVIAAGEHIDLGSKKFIGNLGCDAETAGRILDISDTEIDPVRLDQTVHFLE
jgi:hypothetical protein